ncbi:MAG: toll/interleukin-1 receptor domain-containing protein [Hyphomicrobiaceae bacterium]|nr:toll/interleukin-1 receptor domain-containing protein [Hyphomicrobiaceae bacterium]
MLSYAHADRDVVLALRSRLIGDGYAVWWDGDIPPGESYRSFIAARIREAGATVVVWSVASVASEFVADEAELARILGRLLPVHVDGFDLGTIPLGLGQRQAVPLASYPMLLAALAARGVLPYGGRKGRCRNPHQAPGLGSGDPDGKSNSLPRTRQSG